MNKQLSVQQQQSAMNQTQSGQLLQTQTKFVATNRAKKEVEQNPFKVLIDISDLIEFESNPTEVQKEVQNILLRHNSELKQWYKVYAKKMNTQKSEESFAMTLRQIWLFLRDCQIVGPDSTIAQFDRIYFQGTKNHFTLLGANDKQKFNNQIQKPPVNIAADQKVQPAVVSSTTNKNNEEKKLLNFEDSVIKKTDNNQSEEEDLDEEDEEESLKDMFNTEAEDIHQESK